MTEVEIEGVKFRFQKVKGRAGLRLSTLVVKLVGPFIADMQSGDMGAMLGALATANADDVLVMADMLGPVTEMNVGPDKWVHLSPAMQDEHFSGRTKLMYAWLMYCVKDQFPDFFG